MLPEDSVPIIKLKESVGGHVKEKTAERVTRKMSASSIRQYAKSHDFLFLFLDISSACEARSAALKSYGQKCCRILVNRQTESKYFGCFSAANSINKP